MLYVNILERGKSIQFNLKEATHPHSQDKQDAIYAILLGMCSEEPIGFLLTQAMYYIYIYIYN